jgi:hypothetical protein
MTVETPADILLRPRDLVFGLGPRSHRKLGDSAQIALT